jgi:hypothetical protein
VQNRTEEQDMNLGTRKTLVTLALILVARAADAEGSGSPPWQDRFTVRLEALALLQTLNADLLSHDSATLQRSCSRANPDSPWIMVAVKRSVRAIARARSGRARPE